MLHDKVIFQGIEIPRNRNPKEAEYRDKSHEKHAMQRGIYLNWYAREAAVRIVPFIMQSPDKASIAF